MSLLRFTPLEQKNPKLEPGMAFRAQPSDRHLIRLTHVFAHCAYYLVVTTAAAHRECGKPLRLDWDDLGRMLAKEGANWGYIESPDVFMQEPEENSKRATKIEQLRDWIAPLVNKFESPRILEHEYTQRIEARAEELQVNWISVRRALTRYYYFGRNELALGGLTGGPVPRIAQERSGVVPNAVKPLPPEKKDKSPKRRAGRRSRQVRRHGEHTVVFDDQDVRDMVDTLKERLKPGNQRTTMKALTGIYLHGRFAERHPEAYGAWADKENKGIKAPRIITPRIFRWRTRHVELTDEQQAGLYRPRVVKDTGLLQAKGPNEVCETDGSGGRLWLVAIRDGHMIPIGKCNLYIFIDRWSRFVHGVHITLTGNSTEQLFKALEYAFSPREARFARLGIRVPEHKWPTSSLPTELTTDRGPEFLSKRTVKTVVKHLRIKHSPLRAFFPDGKAIVERFIGTLKARMSQQMKGAFAVAIKDRQTKRSAEWAEAVAVETLEDAYRVLVDIVMDYNNTPHSGLEKIGILKQYGVVPTPKNAYVWGMEHITGRRAPRLSPEQFARMLMTDSTAALRDGVLTHRTYDYTPVDELAMEEARKTPDVRRSVQIKADADLINLYVVVGANRLAHFKATDKTLALMGRMTPYEDELRKEINAENVDDYLADKEREDANARGAPPAKKKTLPTKKVSKAEKDKLRAEEQAALDRKLAGLSPAPASSPDDRASGNDHTASLPEAEQRKLAKEAELIRAYRERQR